MTLLFSLMPTEAHMSVELRSQRNTGKDNANFIFSEYSQTSSSPLPSVYIGNPCTIIKGKIKGKISFACALANPASGKQMSNTGQKFVH